METIIILAAVALVSVVFALFAMSWDALRQARDELQQAEHLLWRVARSHRTYDPEGGLWLRARDGLLDHIDDHIGYDEMGD